MGDMKMVCRACGVMLNGNNIGYVSNSNGRSVFECRTCHAPSRPAEPKPTFKSWQLFGRRTYA
jgi:Zn-finger protein